MVLRQTKNQPSPRPKGLSRQKSGDVFRLDLELARVLSSLAALLLRHGYGAPRVHKLTKTAFVQAARTICAELGDKASIARIAALTGLTRIEVSRILRASSESNLSTKKELNRATRVAIGWMTDRQFTNRQNQPRRLSLAAVRGGFAQLVRKYSGDIPARAMLVEMKRLRMVEQRSDKSVLLIRQRPMLPKSAIKMVQAIAPWVNFLAKSQGEENPEFTTHAQQRTIYFDSLSQALAAIRELETRRRTFLEAIEQLGSTSKTLGREELTISLAIAAAHVSVPNRKKFSNKGRQ